MALQLLRAARAVTARGRLAVTLHSVKEALLGSKAQRMAQWQAVGGGVGDGKFWLGGFGQGFCLGCFFLG